MSVFSLCLNFCKCGTDHTDLFPFEKNCDFFKPSPKVVVREVLPKDYEAIKLLLLAYHQDCVSDDLKLPSSSVSGLTESIVSSILDELEFVDSQKYLMDNLICILDLNLAECVFQIISNFYSKEKANDGNDIDMDNEVETDATKDKGNAEKYVFSDYEELSDIDIDFDNL